jgi:hypothetical protein
MHIRRLHVSLICALALIAATGAEAFDLKDSQGSSLHGEIIKEALGSTFVTANLDLLVKSCDQADEAENLFGASNFKRSLGYLEREQKKFLNAAFEADSSPAARYRTLKHLGVMMRIVQDFYSNSNYVELQVEKKLEKNQHFDPYSLELVEWSTLPARFEARSGIGPAEKKKENSKDGSEKIGDSTYYKVAREMAVRESGRQWDILSTLIKNRYGAKAVTIITALKQASVPAQEPDEND